MAENAVIERGIDRIRHIRLASERQCWVGLKRLGPRKRDGQGLTSRSVVRNAWNTARHKMRALGLRSIPQPPRIQGTGRDGKSPADVHMEAIDNGHVCDGCTELDSNANSTGFLRTIESREIGFYPLYK